MNVRFCVMNVKFFSFAENSLQIASFIVQYSYHNKGMISMIITIIESLFSAVLLTASTTNAMPDKIKISRIFLSVITNFLTVILLGERFGQWIIFPALFLTCLISLYGSKHPFWNFLCGLTGYITAICINYCMFYLIDICFHRSQQYMRIHAPILTNLLYFILYFSATWLLGHLIRTYCNLDTIRRHSPYYYTGSGALLVCALMIILTVIYGEPLGYTPELIQLNALMFVTYFFTTLAFLLFIFHTERQTLKRNMELQYLDSLEDYTQKIEQLYQNMRVFRHDYENILTSLWDYINAGDLDSMKQYFEQELLPVSRQLTTTNTSLEALSRLEIPPLKSLIYSKYIQAQEDKIEVKIEIPQTVSDISMNMIDLIRISGILIDNALDSLKDQTGGTCQIGLLKDTDSIIFIVENSVPEDFVYNDQIFEKYYSTKKYHDGIGLYTVARILDHYDHILHSVNCQNKIFSQKLIIPVERPGSSYQASSLSAADSERSQ